LEWASELAQKFCFHMHHNQVEACKEPSSDMELDILLGVELVDLSALGLDQASVDALALGLVQVSEERLVSALGWGSVSELVWV